MTDTLEGCRAAARPDVAEEYNNYCVQCEGDYMESPATKTYVVPVVPVMTGDPSPVTDGFGAGVAFSGARIDGPAPRDAILDAHTLAPFDDCGGHVNLGMGYHYHALTGCSTEVEAAVEAHAPIVGIALDGHMLHARFDAGSSEPSDLDACRGQAVEGLGYHYHAGDPAANAVLPCLSAAAGCANGGTETTCDATLALAAHGRRGPRDE
ncbi:YHYH protein [Jannaschia sp. W003]|uniref:YHYH protein n=1 Tax=Jannaschia sp. W003 TaxID=2867012 RepID=UPI0021A425C5|nr:YHYH protein [Jannaschia sp. W003]UWQ20135.1 YHYH protein [Jannaschia sp. W003]